MRAPDAEGQAGAEGILDSHTMPKQLDVFKNLRGQASPELLDFLNQVLVFFPLDFAYRLKQVVDALPRDGDNMQKVLELVRSQWRDINSQRWVRIAVTGPNRTGKESLVKAILSRKSPAAASIFTVVETPGLEEFLGYRASAGNPEELAGADVIVLTLDGRYGVAPSTVQLAEGLQRLDKPLLVALTKIDLVEKPAEAVRETRRKLGLKVVPVSVHRPASIDRLLKEIVATNSKALFPLTQSFPEFRRGICDGVVTQAALASSLVGALSIPVSDLLPITAIQTGMLLKIARSFGFRLNRDRARELIPMLVGGVLVREGGHRLRRRFPGHGKLIAVSVAGLWTYGLGRAAIAYFEHLTRALDEEQPFHDQALAEAGR